MNKFKRYRELEKSLEQKYKGGNGNEASLNADDFKDGKLTVYGYDRLKQQCDYIPFSEEIEIKVPTGYGDGFKVALEQLAANELQRIRKDKREARITAAGLLLAGMLCFLLGHLLDLFSGDLFQNIVVIASWVFVWGAVEKWFFEGKDLHVRRMSLLQILTAKVGAAEGIAAPPAPRDERACDTLQ